MDENKFKENIARNITAYRKRINLTQLQLAERLNYSDKAISKWERAEGVPDTLIMLKLCEIFNVTLNDLVADKPKKEKKPTFFRNRIIIPFLSCIGSWLIAIIIYVVCGMIGKNSAYWICFIYALNIDFIVLVVFTAIWGNKWLKLTTISGLIWSTCLSIYLSLRLFLLNANNSWMIFLVGIPVELFFIFFFLLKKRDKNV